MKHLLTQLLNIPTPTFKEKACIDFIESWLTDYCDRLIVNRYGQALIAHFPFVEGLKHICLVGHVDVVPDYFKSYESKGRLYGSGASDMKAADAVFMHVLKDLNQASTLPYNVSVVFYDREEGTALSDNGLYDLIQKKPEFFQSIDCAIVGEPTNKAIQIGCVGSIHATAVVRGQSCHSARPWDGENALYKALPFIKNIESIVPKKETLFGVDFFDVIDITESSTEQGRTSVPGFWTCNVNFRFSPHWEENDAQDYLKKIVLDAGACEVTIEDSVYAGKVIESSLFNTIVQTIGNSIEAKQAWTDVAQLTKLGVPAFNFGPGLTSQAHKKDEYVNLSDVQTYYDALMVLFKTTDF